MTSPQADRSTEPSLLDFIRLLTRRWPWFVLPVALAVAAAVALVTAEDDRYEAEARVVLVDTESQQALTDRPDVPGIQIREMANEIALAEGDAVQALVVDQLGELPTIRIGSDGDTDILVFTAEASSADAAARHATIWADAFVEVRRQQAVAEIATATESLSARLAELDRRRIDVRAPLRALSARIQRADEAEDPDLAAALRADYQRLSGELDHELSLITAEAETTVATLTELQLEGDLAAEGQARVFQVAEVPESSSNTPLVRAVVLALLAGGVIGTGAAVLAELRDDTIRSVDDVRAVTATPVLATIPSVDLRDRSGVATAVGRRPGSSQAEAYHRLRATVEAAARTEGLRSVLVTGPRAGVGATTTASNLALSLSLSGIDAVLVDVDLVDGRVADIYRAPAVPGLADYLDGRARGSQVVQAIDGTGSGRLRVIAGGNRPDDPSVLLASASFGAIVESLEAGAELVVFDAPPVSSASVGYSLGPGVDGVVIVARAGATTARDLAETLSGMDQLGAEVLGIVVTRCGRRTSRGRAGAGAVPAPVASPPTPRPVPAGPVPILSTDRHGQPAPEVASTDDGDPAPVGGAVAVGDAAAAEGPTDAAADPDSTPCDGVPVGDVVPVGDAAAAEGPTDAAADPDSTPGDGTADEAGVTAPTGAPVDQS